MENLPSLTNRQQVCCYRQPAGDVQMGNRAGLLSHPVGEQAARNSYITPISLPYCNLRQVAKNAYFNAFFGIFLNN